MSLALSNPYELTVDGITCKSSPYGAGYYLSNEDLSKLGKNDYNKFTKSLFERYDTAQSEALDGIKVFGLKKPVK